MSWKPKEEFESEIGSFERGLPKCIKIPWDCYSTIELTQEQRHQLETISSQIDEIFNPEGRNVWETKIFLTKKYFYDGNEYCSLIENDIADLIRDILNADKIEIGILEGGCA